MEERIKQNKGFRLNGPHFDLILDKHIFFTSQNGML